MLLLFYRSTRRLTGKRLSGVALKKAAAPSPDWQPYRDVGEVSGLGSAEPAVRTWRAFRGEVLVVQRNDVHFTVGSVNLIPQNVLGFAGADGFGIACQPRAPLRLRLL